MPEFFYTAEKNVQMLIYLLKKNNIRKIIASPGTTNVTFVASLQHDSFFEMYSAADERSAAYMACGLAAESGEPVVLSCTGATASRNYIPGLTEAFYRKLPVLAVTSTQHMGRVGQLSPQVIDRSTIQNDIAVKSVQIPLVHSEEDEWDCNTKLNDAILSLFHRGGGPVHINLTTNYTNDFSVKELPNYRVIKRVEAGQKFPEIKENTKVAIFVGQHLPWNEELVNEVERFCENYNAVVMKDHTSNYNGKYGIEYNLVAAQNYPYDTKEMDLLIDLGNISGAYMDLHPKNSWRVNPDGKIQDRWRNLSYMFDMKEIEFFKFYNSKRNDKNTSYADKCLKEYNELINKLPQLPFSNDWIAYVTANKLPQNSVLHLGILNTLRSWDFFEIPNTVETYCNTGGFGIDGIMSTFLGSTLAHPKKLHFCIIGDLAFFYDLNSLANRHIKNNARILLVNNGIGREFKNYNHFAAQFGQDGNKFMAAQGHYGNKSSKLVRDYATDLGYEYLSASNKEEYLKNLKRFLTPELTDKSMVFEVFTDYHEESDALKNINTIERAPVTMKKVVKKVAKDILGEKNINKVKRIIRG